MFERYTERARRVLFFARYEASQMGSTSIDSEHVLLGLLRESKGVIGVIFGRAHITLDEVAAELQRTSRPAKKVSTSVEIPFSAGAIAALQHAAEEADRLLHHLIGPEHLVLGLLRERDSTAASMLRDHGLDLEGVRQQIARIAPPDTESRRSRASDRDVADAPPSGDDAQAAIEQIKALVRHLAGLPHDSVEAREVTGAILAALDALNDLLGE